MATLPAEIHKFSLFLTILIQFRKKGDFFDYNLIPGKNFLMTISSLEGIFSHQKNFFILINLSSNNREKGAAPPRWGLDLDSIVHI